MGLEVMVAHAGELALGPLLEHLATEGMSCQVVMVDGALQMPGTPVPPGWRDVRLKTPAGVVTLSRGTSAVRVVVFGNADAALQSAQQRVAQAIVERR